MPLFRQVVLSKSITIGDLSLRFEHYDPVDHDVMLVLYDPSKSLYRRLRPFFAQKGQWIDLPNGVRVRLHGIVKQKRITLAIDNPMGLPVTHGYLWERNLRLVDLSAPSDHAG